MATQEIPKQQKIALAVLALIGLYMFYTKAFVPMQEKINKAQEQLEKKQAELDDMKRTAAQLGKLEKRYKQVEEYLKIAETRLPKTEELPTFLKTVTDMAVKYNMNVDNLRVKPAGESTYYVSHPYSLTLQSDFHNFGRFFNEIVQLERIININDVVFTLAESADAEESIQASFDIVTYTAK
jgi:type IV pilus assembly protein PilO